MKMLKAQLLCCSLLWLGACGEHSSLDGPASGKDAGLDGGGANGGQTRVGNDERSANATGSAAAGSSGASTGEAGSAGQRGLFPNGFPFGAGMSGGQRRGNEAGRPGFPGFGDGGFVFPNFGDGGFTFPRRGRDAGTRNEEDAGVSDTDAGQ